MKMSFCLAVVAVALMSEVGAQAAPVAKDNYVVFNIKGDCHQEDCIAAVRDALVDEDGTLGIVSLDAVAVAPHQVIDYKPVIISFKSLTDPVPPYQTVSDKLTSLGYEVASYVIHDTHKKGQDVIIPH